MDYDEYTFTPRAFGQNSAVGREFPDGGGVRLPTSRNVSSPASDETVTPSKDSARSHFPVPKSNYRTNSMPTLSTGTEAFGQHADFPSSPLMNVGRSGATQADYGLEMGASAESFRDRQDFISSAEDYMSTYSQFSNVESEAYYSARLNISSAEDATAKIVMTEKNIQSNNSSTIIGRVDTDRFLPGPSTYRRRQDRTTSLPFIPSPLAQSTFAAGHGYNGPRTPTSAISPGTIGDGRPPSGSKPVSTDCTTPSQQWDYLSLRNTEVSPSTILRRQSIHTRHPTDPFLDTTQAIPTSIPNTLPTTHNTAREPIRIPTITTAPPQHIQQPTTNTTSFHTLHRTLQPGPRIPLPLPPSSHPGIASTLTHTPAARAKLDSQKPAREAWIRESAAEIAALAKLKLDAERRWRRTRKDEDRLEMVRVGEILAEKTDLGKRVEERRGLFMRGGDSQVLRTGEESKAEDGFGGVATMSVHANVGGNANGNVNGQGRLLGWRMALMERVANEVRMSEEEERDAVEKVAQLTDEEKQDLRRDLLARIQTSTSMRKERTKVQDI